METKKQLQHPAGKKAVSMDTGKYNLLKNILMTHLKAKGELTQSEILQAVMEDFEKNRTKFDGSVPWHLEWVKLDLEAKKEIRRTGGNSPVRYAVV